VRQKLELSKLLKSFGYIDLHKPHPGNIIKLGALREIYERLILTSAINDNEETAGVSINAFIKETLEERVHAQ